MLSGAALGPIVAAMLRWAVLLFVGFGASAAQADPYEAIPEKGPLPPYLAFAARFSGPVVHVIDGDSLCVAAAAWPGAA